MSEAITKQAQVEVEWLRKVAEDLPKTCGDAYLALKTAANDIERLHARVQKMEVELVAEAARTAEQKLRADQMSQQHDSQAALNREAREQLAKLEAQDIPWIRVIDEAMVCAHIGVANSSDDYETAKAKLNKLICWELDVAKHFAQEAKQEAAQ